MVRLRLRPDFLQQAIVAQEEVVRAQLHGLLRESSSPNVICPHFSPTPLALLTHCHSERARTEPARRARRRTYAFWWTGAPLKPLLLEWDVWMWWCSGSYG